MENARDLPSEFPSPGTPSPQPSPAMMSPRCLCAWPTAVYMGRETKEEKKGEKGFPAERPHQQSLAAGRGPAGDGGGRTLAAPPCLVTMTSLLKDGPSVQPFRQTLEPHADVLWKSASSWGALCSSRLHRRLRPRTSHHGQGLAWLVVVKITHRLFRSKSCPYTHRAGSLCSVSNLLWLPFWALGSRSILVSLFFDSFWDFRAINASSLLCLVPPAGRQFRISCGHGCPK